MIFDGKVAIVTGSAVGIGRAVAVALADQGADIAGFDVRSLENREMADEVRSRGRKGMAVHCDVADKHDVRRAVAETVQSFSRIDILINNAGIFEIGPLVGADFDRMVDSYERHMGVHARATFLCTLAVVPIMLRYGGGDILNIITNHIHRDRFAIESICHAYDASKWAQWSMTESMAQELKDHNIRVRGLCPAATDTPMLRSFMPEPSPEAYEKITGCCSLMMPEDVALAAVNMLKWGSGGKVGITPLLIHREDAEKLAVPIV